MPKTDTLDARPESTSEEEACAIFWLPQEISNSKYSTMTAVGESDSSLASQMPGHLPGVSWPGLGLQLLPLHWLHLLLLP